METTRTTNDAPTRYEAPAVVEVGQIHEVAARDSVQVARVSPVVRDRGEKTGP